ncbi:MAG: hypothetical protein ACLUVP_02990 [Acutalibacter sp.]
MKKKNLAILTLAVASSLLRGLEMG